MAEVVLLIIGIVILVLCLLLTLFALLFYSGLFESIEIDAGSPPIGEVVFAYKFKRGPYKKAGELFSEISQLCPAEKNYRCLAIYYDDPEEVEESKQQYAVGAILAENGTDVDKNIEDSLISNGYKTCKLPAVSYAVKTKFPYKSSLSIFIAVARVYPKLEKYIKENKLCAHPILEIYDSNQISFMAPLARQDEFCVEEAKRLSTENINDDEDEDDGRSFMDDSTRDTSLCRSEASFTTYASSFVGDEASNIDEEDEDEGDEEDDDPEEERSSCVPQRKKSSTSMDVQKRAVTPEKESQSCPLEDAIAETSSEPVNTPSQGSCDNEKSEDLSDRSDSVSSFEEINIDPKDPMYVN